ncbi:type VI secretion system TssO [Dysgonomonas sp. 25]|uniref:type VI secretion system TssO n=1 Tax=Dysgonomonas sp. 25 TaxID=2302933 RepID=UPI0013D0B07D|nr:type VI secretion system TssO [Dysgonomonas sp. 25]NDV70012.1 type VI secretion system transmembrane protein TssQ [Dysgonomonas sp. 25]
MRAQNSKEIYEGYFRFAGYLVACVAIGVLVYWSFLQTSRTEVERIVNKTEEYDRIYVQQIELSSRIDSLYNYTTKFNTNLNDALLSNSVSKRKQEILNSLEGMANSDVRLHKRLMSQVNTFLAVKDSIRTARSEEDLVKADLVKCMEDNKQTTRRLTIGGITVNK